MKISIRAKIFTVFALCMVASISLAILTNNLFLEKYYVYASKGMFTQAGEEIAEAYRKNPNGIDDFMETLDRASGISSTIAGKKYRVLHTSFTKRQQKEDAKVSKDIQELADTNAERLQSKSVYTVLEKKNASVPMLVYMEKLGQDKLIILTKPMKGVRESTDISNSFYIVTGLGMAVLGSIVMFIFAGKVSKPIVRMSEIARDISNLNFSSKVEVSSRDELGELAISINSISSKLKVNIDSLHRDIEMQKQFARNLSHELKTPIGVIKGYTEGLMFGVADTKEMNEKYCTVIAEECDRMDAMVKDLLTLSTLEASTERLTNVSRFEILSVIATMLERFEPIFKEQCIDFSCRCSENLTMTGDYELIQRALSNIIMNAVKYNNNDKIIKMSVTKEEGRVRITVFNTGSPIPDEELAHIWKVFYKVDKARTRMVGGHGIGLAIVKSIVELHGGEVAVANAEKGVEFTVLIPI